MSNIEDGFRPTPSSVAKSRLASLNRVLGIYPAVAFTDLLSFHLVEALSDHPRRGGNTAYNEHNDIELLYAIPRILESLHHPNRPCAYLNRLRQGLGWAIEVLNEINRKPLSEGEIGAMPTVAPHCFGVTPMESPSTTGECGFYGLTNWQDFFTQDKGGS
ncbi:uncharacterized protein F4822DRAFT_424804 [Hypoxylon trugodes]|uniref:uncharacterized protein n=1 Tax=Hypoxylon trugodes TaxID=326681 RepID=UPI0021970BB7|nr:uncharacterized protein F4822DRAFT_424804 [Hypoxylon trugodes]KAI1394326.1 hypothetical protein F4822DRAFT_424804 [Hypoxylon trugodes]